MKIRTKLGIFPIVLTTITIILSLFIILKISNNAIKKQVENHLLIIIHSRAHNIETLLNNYKDIIRILAVEIPFTNVLDSQIDYARRMTECNLRIKRSIETNPNISEIRILNKNGIVIASSHKDSGLNLSEEAIFIEGKENIYIGEIYKSEFTGNLVLSISAPIFTRDTFSGILIIDFGIDEKLFEILSNRIGFGEIGEIYLVNRDGLLITPSGFMEDTILITKVNTEQFNLFMSEHIEESFSQDMVETPTTYSNYSGREVLGIHYFISEIQWGLFAELNVEEVYKPIKKQSILLIIIFSTLLIVIIIVVIIISRDVTFPIIKLHKGTEEIIKGNLDYKVGIESKDEIGQFSRSFDIMTDKLKKAQKELQNHTEELEKNVKERTSELEKQFIKSEKQRIANLVVLNDLNKTTRELKKEITGHKQVEKEKAKLETQLRHTQKLESIGTLAGGIAHDFNNILTPVLGYTDMALSSLPPSNPLYNDLKQILNGVYRAKDLVQQILTFSRQIEQKSKPLALHLIIKEAIQLLRPSIPSTIEIRQKIDTTCEKVLADPSQMHQVIVNLCTNSFHAMEQKGGVLTIELKQVKIDSVTAQFHPYLEQEKYALLTVNDTGVGMDDATLDRIFEPFYTTKSVDKGTGLGLSVIHGIIHSHNGTIIVHSEPGKGSTFYVYLPILTTTDSDIDTEETKKIQGGHEHILLVDDEESIATMLKKMLELLGYKVDARNSSIEALKTFSEQPKRYDLVITDLTMPKMTGLELAKELHNVHSELPIIIITGYSETISEEFFEHYGINKIIGKPIKLRELAATIREVIDK